MGKVEGTVTLNELSIEFHKIAALFTIVPPFLPVRPVFSEEELQTEREAQRFKDYLLNVLDYGEEGLL